MIDIEAADCFVTNCYIYQKAIVGGGGPTGVIAIMVGSASEPRVADTNIVDVDFGIVITGGSNLIHGFFTAIAAECATTALTIGPPSSSDLCSQLFFNGCVFERVQYSANQEPGIIISSYSVAKNENVSDILFNNCVSHDWGGPGMLIEGGQDITVTGSRFGSNATGSESGAFGGISVLGPATRVSVVGCDLSGLIPPYPAQPNTITQPHGISVTGTVVGIVVRSCNLQGNASGPIDVPTNGTDLKITDCLGYNDQSSVITSSAPTGSGVSAASHGYYGPSVALFHNAMAIGVTLYGASYSMMYGTVPLLTPTDTIQFVSSPLQFQWIGK